MKFNISDDRGNKTKYELKSYDADLDTIRDSVNLSIITDKGKLIYEICSDEREPDIKQIKKFIDEIFNKPFTLSEDFVRCYILITDGIEFRKFTAHKLL